MYFPDEIYYVMYGKSVFSGIASAKTFFMFAQTLLSSPVKEESLIIMLKKYGFHVSWIDLDMFKDFFVNVYLYKSCSKFRESYEFSGMKYSNPSVVLTTYATHPIKAFKNEQPYELVLSFGHIMDLVIGNCWNNRPTHFSTYKALLKFTIIIITDYEGDIGMHISYKGRITNIYKSIFKGFTILEYDFNVEGCLDITYLALYVTFYDSCNVTHLRISMLKKIVGFREDSSIYSLLRPETLVKRLSSPSQVVEGGYVVYSEDLMCFYFAQVNKDTGVFQITTPCVSRCDISYENDYYKNRRKDRRLIKFKYEGFDYNNVNLDQWSQINREQMCLWDTDFNDRYNPNSILSVI